MRRNVKGVSTLDNYPIIIMLVVVTLSALAMMESSHRRHQQERELWQKERKDLIDRIQAPTFAEYTNKVVREKKAEQPQEEAKPHEFVS